MSTETESGSEARVAAQVMDILGGVLNASPEELAAEPVLAGYNWDSMATLEALVALEGEFGIEIDLRELHTQHTAGDLVNLVRAAIDAR
ncbi:acyl carrier protein [Streptomyces sp. NPDC096354]|uniref:acyl carrier protein n=1 Tax=Streptomyces sp. NPDC096354 TaxID=3366088 RepID=UPI0038293652